MKIIYQGDLHVRSTTPANRTDDYLEAERSKLNQLVDFAFQRDAVLLLGGDITDSPVINFKAYNMLYEALTTHQHSTPVYACTGNHDLFFHNHRTLDETAFGALVKSKAVNLIEGTYTVPDVPEVVIHGVGWEQPVPAPIKGKFNILLGHIPVFEGSVPFYFKHEAYTPDTLRKTFPGFDLYLCGDIHKPVVDGNVVVSGSMMRSNIDQIGFKPRCYLIDTETMEISPLFYKIEQDVFSAPDEATCEELNLDHLVAAMKASAGREASFKDDCLTLANDDQPVKEKLQETFDELN